MVKAATAEIASVDPMPVRSKEKAYKLIAGRLKTLEELVMTYVAIPEEGTPYEELFKPGYWDRVSYRLKIGDEIRVKPDEEDYYAWLVVVGDGIGGITVQEIFHRKWEKVMVPESLLDHYTVRYAGPHHRWRIERLSDKHVEKAGFASEGDANKWLQQNADNLLRSRRFTHEEDAA